jgi:SAM-dependent methyltransferase
VQKKDKYSLQKIEIFSLKLFDILKEEINIVERLKKDLNANIGWHYHLDIAWIIREISMLPKGSLILDAGAGIGLLQFILSDLGYNVISIDYSDRVFPAQYVERYKGIMHYLNNQEKTFDNPYVRHLKYVYPTTKKRKLLDISKISRLFKKQKAHCMGIDAMATIEKNKFIPSGNIAANIITDKAFNRRGRIFLYKCDLKHMPLLPDDFVDAVVSVSALEHNDHEDFNKCIDEILRVTKHSGRIAVTVSASQSDDWFHKPSKGWCYSESSIKRLFRLCQTVSSNFLRKDELFEELKKEDNELHKRLAPFYYKSGDNGMPWGKWDPKYQPVGILKINK